MEQTTLPVFVLKNIVLLPHNEIRIELDNNKDKELISLAFSYYNKHLLIVNQKNYLEESINENELPNIGVVAYISMKLDLPNQKTRIVLQGLNRVRINFYTKEDQILLSDIEEISVQKLDKIEEMAYSRSLIKQVEYYIEHDSNMSNSILSSIMGVNDINKVTDILANVIPQNYERKLEYVLEIDPTNRVVMLLDDLNQELKVVELEDLIEEKVAKNLDKSQKEFILQEKIKVIKEELGISFDRDQEIDDLKIKINNLDAKDSIKERLLLELSRYESTPITSPEVGMIKTYIDTMLSLPWNIYTSDNKDLVKAKEMLDRTHYGLEDVKERIIEHLALLQMTNFNTSVVICLVGPPGVGKTSLAKSISLAMERNYTKISVGGVSDEAEIMGHRRTYIGSSPGKIIQGMKKAGSSNPVFVIDEIDKMSKDSKKDPTSCLLEILDREQNQAFCDNYIEEEFDLSKVMFVCTANYKDQISPELLDRLEVIEISSYTEYEKLNICKNYTIPNIIRDYNLKDENITITDKAILKIIRGYTKEAGVRELERLVASIFRKIVKELISHPEQRRFYIIGEDEIDIYLGHEKYIYNDKDISEVGMVNAMSYNLYGGDILKIEVNFYKGKGEIITTGSLGNIFVESAKIALSYIKSNYEKFGIDYSVLENNDIHIHVPEGAIKKDGPSAGIAITTAIISALTNKQIKSNISMTGEMTLRGHVLPIGGLKEKIIGAKRSGIKDIIIPKANKKDLQEVDDYIKERLHFIYVENYYDVAEYLNLLVK